MLTVKALSPDKTVMGEADGIYGPAGNSPLYERGVFLTSIVFDWTSMVPEVGIPSLLQDKLTNTGKNLFSKHLMIGDYG